MPNRTNESQPIVTGPELHQLLLDKWGCSYDLQLRRSQGKIFLQVMWKYLEQASFPRSSDDYAQHLEQIAEYLNAWNSAEVIRQYISETRERPRLGKAVSIPIDPGQRRSEWFVDN